MDQDERNIHNAIYDINQRMQVMRNDITALSKKHDLLLAKLESKINTLEIAFENFTDKIRRLVDDQNQKIGDLDTGLIEHYEYCAEAYRDIAATYLPASSYVTDYRDVLDRIEQTNKAIEKKQDFFNEISRELRNLVSKEIESVRQDLAPIKPEVDLKKEIEDVLTAFRVDMKGVNKELILLKKSKAYSDKKFENIYTLIERLKGEA